MPSGSAGSTPRTRAEMSIGVVAIGSTRPWAPRRRPTQSSARTWSPISSHSDTISRLPVTWPCISPCPAKRCCSTSPQVRPHSWSPQRAASAIRRSPGGSTPNSPRSRPDDPPLSATVTTAVRSSIVRSSCSRRSADNVAKSPCPPPRATAACAVPRATSLPAEVAVGGADGVAGLAHPRGDRLRHGDAAVLAARAADGDLHEALALDQVALGDGAEHREVLLEEGGGAGLREHVVRDGRVAPVLGPQLRSE